MKALRIYLFVFFAVWTSWSASPAFAAFECQDSAQEHVVISDTAAPDTTAAADDCESSSESGSHKHSPLSCDCSVHHRCCHAPVNLRSVASAEKIVIQMERVFAPYVFTLLSPSLEGPFQPPKA